MYLGPWPIDIYKPARRGPIILAVSSGGTALYGCWLIRHANGSHCVVVVEWVGLAPFIGLWSQRTVQKNKRKIKKNEGVSVHFLQAYHFWYEQGSREGCEWRASQLWGRDGVIIRSMPEDEYDSMWSPAAFEFEWFVLWWLSIGSTCWDDGGCGGEGKARSRRVMCAPGCIQYE